MFTKPSKYITEHDSIELGYNVSKAEFDKAYQTFSDKYDSSIEPFDEKISLSIDHGNGRSVIVMDCEITVLNENFENELEKWHKDCRELAEKNKKEENKNASLKAKEDWKHDFRRARREARNES